MAGAKFPKNGGSGAMPNQFDGTNKVTENCAKNLSLADFIGGV